jgi:ABC-type transport system involved in multi-copper enzyme maturation permease subunit
MISFPIVLREFSVAARRKRTFVIRGAFAGLLALVTLVFLLMQALPFRSNAAGYYFLITLSWQVFALLFILLPALTCGCITDEKKDGTLGLLFLTNLNSGDVVLGKFVSRAMDGLLLFLSALPFLFVPVLMGGVGLDQALATTLAVLSLLVLASAVGVFCSTVASGTVQAVVFAYAGLLAYTIVTALLPQVNAVLRLVGKAHWTVAWLDLLQAASPVSGLVQPNTGDALVSLCWSGAFAVVLLGFSIWILPRTLHREASRGRWWRNRTRQNAAGTSRDGRTRSRGLLERNPILWLHFGRGGRWVWQLVVVTVLIVGIAWGYALVPGGMGRGIFQFSVAGVGWLLAFFIKILILFFLARSLAVEKEEGSLELLLSTPLSNQQIVRGKILSALASYGIFYVFLVVIQFPRATMYGEGGILLSLATELSGLVYLLAIGLFFSAWSRTVTQAVTMAILAVTVAGWVLTMVTWIGWAILFGLISLTRVASSSSPGGASQMLYVQLGMTVIRVVADLGIAWVAYRLLVKNLRVYASR